MNFQEMKKLFADKEISKSLKNINDLSRKLSCNLVELRNVVSDLMAKTEDHKLREKLNVARLMFHHTSYMADLIGELNDRISSMSSDVFCTFEEQ